jgi:hypothetical protein
MIRTDEGLQIEQLIPDKRIIAFSKTDKYYDIYEKAEEDEDGDEIVNEYDEMKQLRTIR